MVSGKKQEKARATKDLVQNDIAPSWRLAVFFEAKNADIKNTNTCFFILVFTRCIFPQQKIIERKSRGIQLSGEWIQAEMLVIQMV